MKEKMKESKTKKKKCTMYGSHLYMRVNSMMQRKKLIRGGTGYRFGWITNFFQSKIDDSKEKSFQ
jgi:transposase-like protein